MLRNMLAILAGLVLMTAWLPAQEDQSAKKPASGANLMVPVEAARQPNPVKSTPESLDRAKKWWKMDCAMCHGKAGDGKGETASDMKLAVPDFTNSETLKNRTDGEILYLIKNGHQDMPPEGERLKTDEYWDLVNYIRSLAKTKPAEKPAENKN
jgi:mono/diheme cytochrome c family protein